RGVTLGLIATSAEAAQPMADRLVAAGVTGILNFAPVTLSLPDGVSQVGVDLATELEQLSFAVATTHGRGAAEATPESPAPTPGRAIPPATIDPLTRDAG
ncbi:MAG: redox-sensing transcriptional repressor Rex, partial [Planctomycetota bacterium]